MSDQLKMQRGKSGGSVECLGLTFPHENARREYFLNLLAEKLKDPAFRAQEGFPIGTDDEILNLSDPPYYTACPNPFVSSFITHERLKHPRTDRTVAEPFAADVSEGKNDPIYTAQSYHTKVPHKAIMRYILHYTLPGDVVLDGFCGTGMTGVAANLCSDPTTILSLGYKIDRAGNVLRPSESDAGGPWEIFTSVGPRFAVLNDLSTAASFIAYNYNSPWDASIFNEKASRVLEAIDENFSWMFRTHHNASQETVARSMRELDAKRFTSSAILQLPEINYTIWSDVFRCRECSGEIVFWDAALDRERAKIADQFACSHCGAQLSKRSIDRAWVNENDIKDGTLRKFGKQVPVEINYSFNGKRFSKKPDQYDLEVLKVVDSLSIDTWFPAERMPDGDESRRNDDDGLTHTHHFYTRRNLIILSELYHLAEQSNFPLLKQLLVNMMTRANRQSSLHVSNYFNGGGGVCKGHLSGTLYVPSISPEIPAIKLFRDRVDTFNRWLRVAVKQRRSVISTSSFTGMDLEDESIDYIFLDPPFGKNLMYSELNFIDESWLRVRTQAEKEAIESKTQGKGISEYRALMTACFKEAFRVLRSGRWMTVEFSNTQANVWNAIQAALHESGFVVANVAALDKKQGSFKAVNTTTAVKQDLVISAYKPGEDLEQRFKREINPESSVWDFVRSHLSYLPTTKIKSGTLEFVAERDPRIIFDRMVSWFIRHEAPVPISTHEFQAGLIQRFSVRDGMVFLPEQVAQYDKKRALVSQAPQMEFFVADERSAIDWLTDFLRKRPATYQELHPEFTTQLGAGWKKHESRPELSALLEDNFLRYDGSADVPSQIHNYLSTNYHDLRNLEKSDLRLKAKAKDRWFVPDPNKAQDLEKKREKALLKEFEEYRKTPGRKLKEFRLEVLRAGFKAAWASKDYQTIVSIANKVPEDALQEDEKLLFWYDSALTRTGG